MKLTRKIGGSEDVPCPLVFGVGVGDGGTLLPFVAPAGMTGVSLLGVNELRRSGLSEPGMLIRLPRAPSSAAGGGG